MSKGALLCLLAVALVASATADTSFHQDLMTQAKQRAFSASLEELSSARRVVLESLDQDGKLNPGPLKRALTGKSTTACQTQQLYVMVFGLGITTDTSTIKPGCPDGMYQEAPCNQVFESFFSSLSNKTGGGGRRLLGNAELQERDATQFRRALTAKPDLSQCTMNGCGEAMCEGMGGSPRCLTTANKTETACYYGAPTCNATEVAAQGAWSDTGCLRAGAVSNPPACPSIADFTGGMNGVGGMVFPIRADCLCPAPKCRVVMKTPTFAGASFQLCDSSGMADTYVANSNAQMEFTKGSCDGATTASTGAASAPHHTVAAAVVGAAFYAIRM